MGFPASELKAVEYDEDDDSKPPRVRTTFMGMYGVDSPLPTAYLDDITQRREGHEALQGFLDIFSHRILTQFYRIWRKYSYPATFEPGGTDTFRSRCWAWWGWAFRHGKSYCHTGVALSGAAWRAATTGQNPGRHAGAGDSAGPEYQRKVSPYCLRPVEISQPLGFYAMMTFCWMATRHWGMKRWMPTASC
jgi:type VI secretion system protein ImpH